MTLEWLQPLQSDPSGANKEDVSPFLFWVYLGVSIALVTMAGLMSGLTLGLMSLDELDLEVLKRSGTEQEKRHARRIMPVIKNEHFLLVTLLLFNALSTEALPIFLDKLVDPVTAVLLSVTVVLVIGEILPQAVCRSYGLQVGSYSALFVRLLMMLSAPITWPIGKLLDWLLGDEQTALFRRAQLKALVGLHSSAEGLGGNLSADEISIITGALDLTSKTAWTAMTPLNKVFMLPSDRRLDEATLQEVLVSGHSRVPVHRPGDRCNLLGLILVKELVLVDPDEGLTAGQLVGRSLPRLPADIPMYQLLRLFEAGGSHMVALTRPRVGRPSVESDTSAAAQASTAASGPIIRTSSTSGNLPAPGIHRIKSGVIKTGDNMLYIEAEQRAPLSPKGSWVAVPAAGAGWGVVGGSPAPRRDSADGEGVLGPGLFAPLWGPHVQEGDPVGIITIEDVIEELLQQEIIDETDQYVDNMQVTRVDAYNLTTSLPPRLRKAYAQQFTPRVGRLVVHHPSHHNTTGSWKGLTVLKQQQMAPRGAYSNPTTPLAGSPDSSTMASPLSTLSAGAAGALGFIHKHTRLSGDFLYHQPQPQPQQQQQQQQHMQQVPEQQQLRLGGEGPRRTGSGPSGIHNVGHGLRHAAVHLPTQAQQHHLAAGLLRRNSADSVGLRGGREAEGMGSGGAHSWGTTHAPGSAGSGGSGSGSSLLNRGLLGRQQAAQQPPPQQPLPDSTGVAAVASAAAAAAAGRATDSVPVRGISRAHSADTGRGAGSNVGGVGGAVAAAATAAVAGFGSVVEVADIKRPLLASDDDEDDDS